MEWAWLWLCEANGQSIGQFFYTGRPDQVTIDPRDLLRQIIASRTDRPPAFVILEHGHTGGSSAPSRADIMVTRQLAQTLSLFDVTLYDHRIHSAAGRFSFREHGYL